jgi:hypothetical protein
MIQYLSALASDVLPSVCSSLSRYPGSITVPTNSSDPKAMLNFIDVKFVKVGVQNMLI